MTYISPHQSSADNVHFSPAAEETPAQHSSTTSAAPQRTGAPHLPGSVAGQGASRHPLQNSEAKIDLRVPFYSLPIELRNKIADGLDVATKLNLKLTCRQAYAEGNQLHFDISVSNGNELDDALVFFGQAKGSSTVWISRRKERLTPSGQMSVHSGDSDPVLPQSSIRRQ